MHKKKIDILLDYMHSNDRIKSIKLVSSFPRFGNKEEKRIVEIASECYKGKEEFYKSIGYDTIWYKNKAWELIMEKYGEQLRKHIF